jgi:hypothetical protein
MAVSAFLLTGWRILRLGLLWRRPGLGCGEQQMFDMVVNALPKESLRMVLDLITDPPEDLPYAEIKELHSSSHQLTGFQRLEKLHTMATGQPWWPQAF